MLFFVLGLENKYVLYHLDDENNASKHFGELFAELTTMQNEERYFGLQSYLIAQNTVRKVSQSL